VLSHAASAKGASKAAPARVAEEEPEVTTVQLPLAVAIAPQQGQQGRAVQQQPQEQFINFMRSAAEGAFTGALKSATLTWELEGGVGRATFESPPSPAPRHGSGSPPAGAVAAAPTRLTLQSGTGTFTLETSPTGAPREVVTWRRMEDMAWRGGRVWYESTAGETAWELPRGAYLEHPAESHQLRAGGQGGTVARYWKRPPLTRH
jgi:hypothetical protein